MDWCVITEGPLRDGAPAGVILMWSCTCEGVLTQDGNVWQRHQYQLLHVLLQETEQKL